MSPFNTHLPILEYALDRHNEYVIEFGGGEFSTPLIIKKSKESTTFENNYDWFQKLSYLHSDNHRIIHDENYLEAAKHLWLYNLISYRFSLAFIDGDNWDERCSLVYYLRDKCDVIILHDSFPQHLDRCVNIFSDVFTSICNMRNFTVNSFGFLRPDYPPTLCLSNYVDFNDWDIKNV